MQKTGISAVPQNIGISALCVIVVARLKENSSHLSKIGLYLYLHNCGCRAAISDHGTKLLTSLFI